MKSPKNYRNRKTSSILLGKNSINDIRDSRIFNELTPIKMSKGIHANLLETDLDIRAAQLNLEAQKLDVKVAKVRFILV